MPTRLGKDSKSCYMQWGDQKKYYFTCGNDEAMERARAKANKQGQAVHASESRKRK